MIRMRAVALSLSVVLVPALAGCHSGLNAETGMQGASGNGVEVESAGVQVNNATIVAGNQGSGRAAFLGTVFNTSTVPDQLVAISAGTAQAKLLPNPIPLPPGQGVSIQTGKNAQAGFIGLDAPAGTYVPVRMVFRTAGAATFSALVVPPVGYYREAAPIGTRPILEKVRQLVGTATH